MRYKIGEILDTKVITSGISKTINIALATKTEKNNSDALYVKNHM